MTPGEEGADKSREWLGPDCGQQGETSRTDQGEGGRAWGWSIRISATSVVRRGPHAKRTCMHAAAAATAPSSVTGSGGQHEGVDHSDLQPWHP